MERAVQMAKNAIFTNAGQMCWAGSRLFLHEEIYAKCLNVEPGLDEKTEFGHLASKDQQERVLNYIKSGLEDGARLVIGEDVAVNPALRMEFFVKPTISADVESSMKIGCEETFGPVLTVFKFSSTEEVVRMANDTQFGFNAGVWTNNLKLAQQMVTQLRQVLWP